MRFSISLTTLFVRSNVYPSGAMKVTWNSLVSSRGTRLMPRFAPIGTVEAITSRQMPTMIQRCRIDQRSEMPYAQSTQR